MEIDNILTKFDPINLDEMDTVKMMNRIDTKYVTHENTLVSILDRIKDDYRILEMKNLRDFPYKSLYYDTIDNCMYLSHHNGKPNRFKIRFRKYMTSDDTFLEIKFKHKGSRTFKNRIEIEDIEQKLSRFSTEYIEEHTPFSGMQLEAKIYTNFSRITLVNKDFTERATIDHDLVFQSNGDGITLNNIVIVETKRDGNAGRTPLFNALYHHGIYSQGMSKYCIGTSLLNKDLKHNNFKERILLIKKIQEGKQYVKNLSPTI